MYGALNLGNNAAFLIGDNNRNGLVEPNRLIFNSSANEERSNNATLWTRDFVSFYPGTSVVLQKFLSSSLLLAH